MNRVQTHTMFVIPLAYQNIQLKENQTFWSASGSRSLLG